jgi:hypothetical protein
VYSTEARAEDRIERARELPGFQDEPECFFVSCYVVDEDHWRDGYVTIARPDP